jgi:L-threonylcarbamoyladenylate synthase
MRITQRLSIDDLGLAGEMLRRGQLVAFPTETVYGLGADALQPEAVRNIYLAKGRPSDNPLIVHLGSFDQLTEVAMDLPALAARLIDRFWPGPLTLVLRKTDRVSDLVSGNLNTVAVRMPNHPIALELLQRAQTPVVAPSANRSGRPSATHWQSVLEDLEGRIDGVILGESTSIGLESTVLDLTQSVPCILRAGAITAEELHDVCPDVRHASETSHENELRKSPGTRHRHYQPTAMVLLDCARTSHGAHPITTDPRLLHKKIAWIGLGNPPALDWLVMEPCSSVEVYARRVYAFFREMDHLGIEVIVCSLVDEAGIGLALNDRLNRAANDRI